MIRISGGMRWSWALLVLSLVVLAGCALFGRGKADTGLPVDLELVEHQAEDVLDFVSGETESIPVVRMRERESRIAELKGLMCLGEDNRGYLVLRTDEAEAKEYLADAEKKNAVQKLLAAENADRKELYREIAELNGIRNVTLTDVERVFAMKRLKRAQPGDVFQLPEDEEWFEEFKSSSVGKRLGARCRPGIWITFREEDL